MEWKRPTPPCPACLPKPALPPYLLTSLKPVTPQERETQDVGMAVSMDTISIVTMWGEGGGADGEVGGIKGGIKIYIYKSIFSLERLCLNERCAIPFDSILKLSS